MDHPIFLGNTPLHQEEKEVGGGYVLVDGEKYYKISNHDRMQPFFMSLVSDSDHWMFLSSNGALSAGRRNPDHALFPYYTDDKITDAPDITGSKSLFLVTREGRTYFWEPFSDRYHGIYSVSRNLYKNIYGNKVIFEEINHDLELQFSYRWNTSEQFGFVKKARLVSLSENTMTVQTLDGIQNILPSGVGEALQNMRSTLVDAYKKNELEVGTSLGLFMLSAFIVDKPVPSESLKTTTVFSRGLDKVTHLLSSRQLDDFRKGKKLREEVDVRAERGAYFIHSLIELPPAGGKTWYIIADVDQGPSEVAWLTGQLKDPAYLTEAVEGDIKKGTENLINLVANADGIQLGRDERSIYRHFSNVLFNIMRGGVFDQHYAIDTTDFHAHLLRFNKSLAGREQTFLKGLPPQIPYQDLIREVRQKNDPDLERLTLEYLPLVFSRRHGDPSRPWNRFSIETKKEDGSRNVHYEGNWRDIFQNWEALALSYPAFIEGMIAKFVNASTIDGYNPYRITKDGIDWEVIEPDDPWSFIGYWGDHQIIYLLKLLEIAQNHDPDGLRSMLSKMIFSFANVPYRIKPYSRILENPRDTIDFDRELEIAIHQSVERQGADGKLIWNAEGAVYRVNFVEKLLVPVLAKFSNFIPEGGIWLNTQRPEWNDANNALVGNGVSMVTLYYLYRFQVFCRRLFRESGQTRFTVSTELAGLLKAMIDVFAEYHFRLSGPFSDAERKQILDRLGEAGSRYREQVYAKSDFHSFADIDLSLLDLFFDLSIDFLEHSIRAGKRSDGLYHAYNLMEVENAEALSVRPLYEMLEGQVAVLSAGYLSPEETLEVLDALKKSALFREDQYSYLLYPDRQLPRFVEKNNIPGHRVEASDLLKTLIFDGNTELVEKDVLGRYHFNSSFHNAEDVKAVLRRLRQKGYEALVDREEERILDIFEELFDHRSFTGRSGTFYGYEGLGCIYWHMVSKLLLAVEENFLWAEEKKAGPAVLGQLMQHYYDIRAGIGLNKTPEVYGAFPTDPYSHTPGNAGAQQPGMTGQVKEDILARVGEIGVFVRDGQIHFHPSLFRREEFLEEAQRFHYYDLEDTSQVVDLEPGSFAFTYCKVPVVYTLGETPRVEIEYRDGSREQVDGLTLDRSISGEIFNRTGRVRGVRVRVSFPPNFRPVVKLENL